MLASLAGFAVRLCLHREHGQIGKTLKPVPGRSTRAITHLIHEVRPSPGQRVALFKNAPGVFVPGRGTLSSSDRVPFALR